MNRFGIEPWLNYVRVGLPDQACNCIFQMCSGKLVSSLQRFKRVCSWWSENAALVSFWRRIRDTFLTTLVTGFVAQATMATTPVDESPFNTVRADYELNAHSREYSRPGKKSRLTRFACLPASCANPLSDLKICRHTCWCRLQRHSFTAQVGSHERRRTLGISSCAATR